MKFSEVLDTFNTLYNNINNGAAPGLLEEEIAVVLDKAQDEILKNYFNPKGNKYGEGFDQSPKRQIDFSSLLKIVEVPVLSRLIGTSIECTLDTTDSLRVGSYTYKPTEKVTVQVPLNISEPIFSMAENTHTFNVMLNGYISYPAYIKKPSSLSISNNYPTDKASAIFVFDSTSDTDEAPIDSFGTALSTDQILSIVNEEVIVSNNMGIQKTLQVKAISNLEYLNYFSSPYKEPLKNQAWRIFGEELPTTDNKSINTTYDTQSDIELSVNTTSSTTLNLVIKLQGIKYSISGLYWKVIVHTGETPSVYRIRYIKYPKSFSEYEDTDEVELPHELCPEVIQRALELAKSYFEGELNTVIELGKRSE